MDIWSLIVKAIDKIVTTSINLSRKRIVRDTLEKKSAGDLAIAQILAPAQKEQADEETKQALLRVTAAKIKADQPQSSNVGPWLIFLLFLVVAGAGFFYINSSNSNDRGNSNSG